MTLETLGVHTDFKKAKKTRLQPISWEYCRFLGVVTDMFSSGLAHKPVQLASVGVCSVRGRMGGGGGLLGQFGNFRDGWSTNPWHWHPLHGQNLTWKSDRVLCNSRVPFDLKGFRGSHLACSLLATLCGPRRHISSG